MLEKQIEKKVSDYAKTQGYLSFKFNSMACRAVPDRLFITPYGFIIFIEFKRAGAKPTEKQELMHSKLRAQGCLAFVVSDVEDGKHIIDWYRQTRSKGEQV
jgi:hypothetical protein